MLICGCLKHPIGRLGNAICVRGHSIRVCMEPDCLDRNTSCPTPGCGSLITVSGPAEERLAKMRLPNGSGDAGDLSGVRLEIAADEAHITSISGPHCHAAANGARLM